MVNSFFNLFLGPGLTTNAIIKIHAKFYRKYDLDTDTPIHSLSTYKRTDRLQLRRSFISNFQIQKFYFPNVKFCLCVNAEFWHFISLNLFQVSLWNILFFFSRGFAMNVNFTVRPKSINFRIRAKISSRFRNNLQPLK